MVENTQERKRHSDNVLKRKIWRTIPTFRKRKRLKHWFFRIVLAKPNPNIDTINFVITGAKTRGEFFTPTGAAVHYLGVEAKKDVQNVESMITHSVNASFYDIREYFQSRNEKGTMKTKSEDETYNRLLGTLRENLRTLTEKIQPKVYEYGFLKN